MDPIAEFGRKTLDTIAYFSKIRPRASEGDIHQDPSGLKVTTKQLQLSLASEGDTHQGPSSITIGYKQRVNDLLPEQKIHPQSSQEIEQFCGQRAEIKASFWVQPSSFSFSDDQHSAAHL